jgi:hypothetical protein
MVVPMFQCPVCGRPHKESERREHILECRANKAREENRQLQFKKVSK